MIHLSKGKLAFVTVLVSVGFISNLSPGLTQISLQVSSSPPKAPGTGSPQDPRTPGGTRGNCKLTNNQTDKRLTVLVPIDLKGETTTEYPVFWFYIPDSPENLNTIEFSIHDQEDRKTFYRTSLKLTKTPGIIGVPLPAKPEHSLKLNQTYIWKLVINCDQKVPSGNVLEVNGLVTRVQQNPNAWYDQLTNLGKRNLAEPQNPEVKKAWAELLKSVGLEKLAQEPVVDLIKD